MCSKNNYFSTTNEIAEHKFRLLHGLECCLRHLGGVPKALVPDNLKAAVERADRYEPTINRTMEEFANHYGTVVVPARARKPQDKASVKPNDG